MSDESLKNCPICGFEKSTVERELRRDAYWVSCERCGEFSISHSCAVDSDIIKKIKETGYILSGLFREFTETGVENKNKPMIKTVNIDELLNHSLVPTIDDIEEKAEKLLQRIKEKTKHYGRGVPLYYEKDYPLAYAQNTTEFVALLEFLEDGGYITASKGSGVYTAKLSSTGWELAKKFGGANKDSECGFVAVWFADDGSMNASIDAIETAIQECNFKPICIRDKHFPETIMAKALGEIRKSRFIVVDLTGERVDVAFEAGFAHGLNIEAIYVYDKSKHSDSLPRGFYTKHFQCHGYCSNEELKEIVKRAIGERIKIEK